MLSEPERDVEYTLVRFVDSQLHVATFIRYHDDSGTIRHGQYHLGIEFNWPALLDCWLAMRDVGWQTLDDAHTNGLLAAGSAPSCDCRTFDDQALAYLHSGMPIPELNRRVKEEGQPIQDRHDRILWGG